MIAPVPLGPLLRAFFADLLVQQRTVSPQAVNAYRDAFRLLLTFLDQHRLRKPDALTLDDLDAPAILAFLDHLEENRGNTVQSRNARLTAVRPFVRFAALRTPQSLDLTFRVLAISRKRAPRRQCLRACGASSQRFGATTVVQLFGKGAQGASRTPVDPDQPESAPVVRRGG